MRKIFFVATLALSMFACSLNPNSQVTKPKNPTEFAQIVYAYRFNNNGGADFGFFAEKTDSESSITFEGGHSPRIEDLAQRVTDRPLANLKITLTNDGDDNEVSGTTDAEGHASLSTTSLTLKAGVDGHWYCIPVAKWKAWSDDLVVIGGGGLWRCEK